MKNKCIIGVRLITFVVVFGLCMGILGQILRLSNNVTVAGSLGFYKEPDQSLDVVVIGASDVYAGYCPTKAWSKFGYTSYALGISAAPGTIYKSMVREILAHQKPKVLVVEVDGFIHGTSYYNDSIYLHGWIDYIKDEKNKEYTIQEAVPKEKQKEFRAGYFPTRFIADRHNWKKLRACAEIASTRWKLFWKDKTDTKGYGTMLTAMDQPADNTAIVFEEENKKVLISFLEYCKQVGVEKILFTRFPHCSNYGNLEALNQIKEIVNSYGYDFKEFESSRNLIFPDINQCFFNSEHMNPKGAEAFTIVLGTYLTEHYDLSVQHTQEIINSWNKSAEVVEQALKDYSTMDPSDLKRFDFYEGAL